MSTTTVLMGEGSWNLSLLTNGSGVAVPPSIWNDIMPWDHVCIGSPGLLETVTSDADRLAQINVTGGYAGVITRIDDAGSLSGPGLSWWLGNAEGRGPRFGAITLGSSTTSVWLDQFLPSNGITKGTVSGGTSFAGSSSPASLGIDLLNWVAAVAGCEWRMRADGAVDMAPSATLFPAPTSTSGVVLTRRPASREGDFTGVAAVSMNRVRDAEPTISEAWVTWAASTWSVSFQTATQTPVGVRFKGFTGSTPQRGEFFDQVGETSSAAAIIAAMVVGARSLTPIEVTLSSETHALSGAVTAGSRVWVFDREMGISDTANTIVRDGEVLQPLQARVTAITEPIARGRGVYARVDGGARWHDLTPFVAWEEPVATWEVTTGGVRRNSSPIRVVRDRATPIAARFR